MEETLHHLQQCYTTYINSQTDVAILIGCQTVLIHYQTGFHMHIHIQSSLRIKDTDGTAQKYP